MTTGEPAPPAGRRALWIARFLLLAAFVALERWTHGAWANPLVDFGRELYVPWRLSVGERLGRDLAWLNGPLSPLWNAFLFRLFGASLRTLTTANLLLLAGGTLLLHQLLRRLAGLFAATVATLLFLALCGFGFLSARGNYNFVCPYSHDLVHGFWLALAALAALFAWVDHRRAPMLALAGLACGLCFLTKPEVSLALGTAISGILALDSFRGGSRSGLDRRRALAGFAGAASLPLLASVAASAAYLPFGEALRQTAGGWRWIARPELSSSYFYRHLAGIDAPLENLARLVVAAAAWLAALGALAAISWAARHAGERAVRIAWALAPLVVAALLSSVSAANWLDAARPLPLFAATSCVVAAHQFIRRGGSTVREIEVFGFSLFGFVLLAKIVLASKLWQYGFVLAAPALALVALALLHWIPDQLALRGGGDGVFRALATAVLAAWTLASLGFSSAYLHRRQSWVGEGADAFRVDAAEAAFVARVGSRIAAAGSGTLLVLPEGATFNWLLHRVNPTPYVSYMPPEVALFGEASMLAALERHPPDLLLIWNRETAEYGVREFGSGYAAGTAAWIRDAYEAAAPNARPEPRAVGEPAFVLLRRRLRR